MQYKLNIKEEVRKLRRIGKSLGFIASKTNVPRTTIRSWIKDIVLTEEQRDVIRSNALQHLQEGRRKAQQKNKKKRNCITENMFKHGIKDVGKLNERELFIAGIALYWAEGFKNVHEHRLGFCNSDPTMIRFYLQWLEKSLNVDKKDVILRVTLNKVYEPDTKRIEEYWSELTGIPLQQFTKPFYQNSIWKKQFNKQKYNGVLRVHVKDSLEYLFKMRGWIEGLRSNIMPG